MSPQLEAATDTHICLCATQPCLLIILTQECWGLCTWVLALHLSAPLSWHTGCGLYSCECLPWPLSLRRKPNYSLLPILLLHLVPGTQASTCIAHTRGWWWQERKTGTLPFLSPSILTESLSPFPVWCCCRNVCEAGKGSFAAIV